MNSLSQAITQVNSDFGKWKRSSLHGVLTALGGSYTGAGQDARNIQPAGVVAVQNAINFIPYAKRQKYTAALAYLAWALRIDPRRAVPIKPRMSFRQFKTQPIRGTDDAGNFVVLKGKLIHVHRLVWESSDGRLQSLGNVRTRELVQNMDQPDGPPFNHVLANVPYPNAFLHPGVLGSLGAQTGYNDDDHSTLAPGLICRRPLVVDNVQITQQYEYSADGGANWERIDEAAYILEKGVRQRIRMNGHFYYFIKRNWQARCTRTFHFEVGYPIDVTLRVPNAFPANMGFANVDNFNDQAVGGRWVRHVDQAAT